MNLLRPKEYTSSQSLSELFEAQAERTPDFVAVGFEDQHLTYREINERANKLAHYLRRSGVGPDVLVGMCVERSLEMVVGILGIIKAGGAYVPLDVAYPKERLAFMLQDSSVNVLLTQGRLLEGIPTESLAKVICLDTDWNDIARESNANLDSGAQAENLAYVIYTSGSTGKPKGVLVTHRNVARLFTATDHWYHFSSADVWTLFHSFAFDFSVWEIWGALLYGGRIVVVPYLVSRTPNALYELLSREKVTVLNQTPSAFRQLVWVEQNAEKKLPLDLRYVIFGGEALELQSLKPWFELHGDKTPLLVNMYGITETTVHVTYRPITLQDVVSGQGSLIGVPIPDLQVHVLGSDLTQLPVGEAGEMYVGGEGLARGYLNRPELNAERFIPDPFCSVAKKRLYKTGDVARRLPNGDLEYLGRSDDQVKIRGFRIELGEIETVLSSHPAVRECVLLAQAGGDGEKRLIAHVVFKKEAPSISDLRAFLKIHLPEYMVPAVFNRLDTLPLTPNGKVDRRALARADATTSGGATAATELSITAGERPKLNDLYVAPRLPEETLLADIWSEVLEVNPVGIHDNYFELGGDSIRVIRILARAQQQGMHLSFEQIFKEQTIAKLVQHVRSTPMGRSSAVKLQPFDLVATEDRQKLPAGLEDAYPMVALQAGIYIHCELNSESAVFRDTHSFQIFAAFDQEKLETSLHQIFARHAPLRTSFDFVSYSEPLQLVHPEVRVPFTVEDLRHLAPHEQHKALLAWFADEKKRPFLWSEAPLLRIHVQLYGEQQFQFIMSFHHIIFDGWSLAAFLTQVFQDYFSRLNGAFPTITPLQTGYREYVALEKEAQKSEAHRRFWTEKLADPTISTVPRWPKSMCKGGAEQVRGPEIIVPTEVFAGLKQLAQIAGVPLRTVLLTAHMKVMSVVYGTSDVLSNMITNGRQEELDAEQMVGLCLNSLPLRMKLTGGSWLELCRETFAADQEIIPHRRFPLVEVQKLGGGQSLIETLFDFVNFHVYRGLEGYPNCRFKEGHYYEANDFTLAANFLLDSTSTVLEFHFDYLPEQLPEEQISEFCDYYINTLAAMASDPEARYESFSPLSETEKNKLLVDWNDTAREYGAEARLHRLIERQTARTPDHVALEFEGRELTYAQLNARANQLARVLRAKGVGSGVLVGVFAERSFEMVVSLLAILKAGGAYVPLDPSYPSERLRHMLEDARAPMVLLQPQLAGQLPACDAEVLRLDASWAALADESGENLQDVGTPEDLAYVIFTSGSTGRPKGAMNAHRGICNRLLWMQDEYVLTENDRVLQKTPFSFDVSVWEFFWPLMTGARLVIARPEGHKDAGYLVRLIRESGITTMHSVPSMMSVFLEDAGVEGCSSLKRVICSGEVLPHELQERFFARLPEVELHNLYGPTEAAVDVTYWACRRGDKRTTVPIGRPIANTQIYVLDGQMRPVPVGVSGELYIGGVQVGRGYVGRPDLTAERFVPDPFSQTPGARLYRTGDLVRHLPDGAIEYLGRLDHQVKIRGQRIELGEIESGIAQHPSVREVVAIAREDVTGDRRLVAYVVAENAPADLVTELRAYIRASMPEYMVPAHFVILDALPLTSNGKIDRNALPAPERSALEGIAYVAPRTPTEKVLAGIWCDVLKLENVSVTENFFDLGGQSLLAMQVMSRVRIAFDMEFPLQSFFESPTVEGMSTSILSPFATRAQLERRAELFLKVAEFSESEVDSMLKMESKHVTGA